VDLNTRCGVGSAGPRGEEGRVERLEREPDGEAGPLATATRDGETATVASNDSFGDEKSEPDPAYAWFGSVEGLEDARQMLLIDARSRIRYDDHDLLAITAREI
jgi:hypothetical protein